MLSPASGHGLCQKLLQLTLIPPMAVRDVPLLYQTHGLLTSSGGEFAVTVHYTFNAVIIAIGEIDSLQCGQHVGRGGVHQIGSPTGNTLMAVGE